LAGGFEEAILLPVAAAASSSFSSTKESANLNLNLFNILRVLTRWLFSFIYLLRLWFQRIEFQKQSFSDISTEVGKFEPFHDVINSQVL
jgi:hypothetical protein